MTSTVIADKHIKEENVIMNDENMVKELMRDNSIQKIESGQLNIGTRPSSRHSVT
jgi:hypothetical protein